MTLQRSIAVVLAAGALAACAPVPRAAEPPVPPPFEAIALTGRELPRPAVDPARLGALESDLAAARRELRAHPQSEDAHIWVGRRLAYLGRYREAVDVYTAALRRFPESSRLLRHRGHRNLTLRHLDAAVADLTRAADLARGVPDEPEPDGAPNRWNIPRSTRQSNIYYHLGLAYFLLGDTARARSAYETCLRYAAVNDDMLVATLYWMCNTAVRAGDTAEAHRLAALASPEMAVIENHAYHRLLMAFADGTSEELLAQTPPGTLEWVTTAYGVSIAREAQGDAAGATALREEILQTPDWPAFGYLAAEADLARTPPPEPAP